MFTFKTKLNTPEIQNHKGKQLLQLSLLQLTSLLTHSLSLLTPIKKKDYLFREHEQWQGQREREGENLKQTWC